MDNIEYIKSLEERIEALEKIIASIEIKDAKTLTVSNCSIQNLALGKCKSAEFNDTSAQVVGFVSFNTKINTSTINEFKNNKGKFKFYNCTTDKQSN